MNEMIVTFVRVHHQTGTVILIRMLDSRSPWVDPFECNYVFVLLSFSEEFTVSCTVAKIAQLRQI
jgi:hypothetical protein